MPVESRSILTSLEVAAGVTAGFVLFLGFIVVAALPRLRNRWQAHQPAQIPMPCTDPLTLRAQLARSLSPYGYHPVGTSSGPFQLEPSGFRKWLGAKVITVTFPMPQEAIITGEARYLARLTADRQVWFIAEGAVPFWPWVRRRLTLPFAVITGFLFCALFLLFWVF